MKNSRKILSALLISCSASVALASPYGISCTKPVINDTVRDTAPIAFSFTCTNGTPASFSTVQFAANQLSSGPNAVMQIDPISNMTAGKTVTVQGTITVPAANSYVFDLTAQYDGTTHNHMWCNDPASAACMAFTITDPSFLGISDIHYDKDLTQSNYTTDTSPTLWSDAKSQLQQVIATKKPKFILLTGDLPAHNDATRSDNVKTVLTDFSSDFTLPVYYVPGNNDSLGGDYHSFTNASGVTPLSLDPNKNWPTLNVSHSCANDPTAPCTLDMTSGAQFGYYSARPEAGLRLIALNTVIFTKKYVADDGVSQADATTKELNWLTAQLAEASHNNEAVVLAMHVPPGVFGYNGASMWVSPQTQSIFMNTVTSYKSIIRGIYSAHVHLDEFRRLYDSNKNMAILDVSTPSISPVYSNNPGMRVFSYDPNSFNLTNMETDYTTPTQSASWNKYSFNQDYSCGTKNLFDCVKGLSLSTDPNNIFMSRYIVNYSVRNAGFPPEDPLGWPGVLKAIDIFA